MTKTRRVAATIVLATALVPFAIIHFGAKPEPSIESFERSQSCSVAIAAHRGGWQRDFEHRAPENSLANLEKAVRLGFDIYETDVWVSKDGEFIIIHDPTVDRTTTGSGRVDELSLAELKELRLKYRNGELSDEKVPTLAELLRRARGRIKFKIDFKAPISTFPRAVQLVNEIGVIDQVIFRFWWEPRIAKKLREYFDDGLPYVPTLIMFRARNEREVRDAAQMFELGLIEIHVEPHKLTREKLEAIRMAHEHGLLVETHAWGSQNDWDRLIRVGVCMFHTKEPERMLAYLRERGLHP